MLAPRQKHHLRPPSLSANTKIARIVLGRRGGSLAFHKTTARQRSAKTFSFAGPQEQHKPPAHPLSPHRVRGCEVESIHPYVVLLADGRIFHHDLEAKARGSSSDGGKKRADRTSPSLSRNVSRLSWQRSPPRSSRRSSSHNECDTKHWMTICESRLGRHLSATELANRPLGDAG